MKNSIVTLNDSSPDSGDSWMASPFNELLQKFENWISDSGMNLSNMSKSDIQNRIHELSGGSPTPESVNAGIPLPNHYVRHLVVAKVIEMRGDGAPSTNEEQMLPIGLLNPRFKNL